MKYILAAIFAGLWLMDTGLTLLFIGVGGTDLEFNPLMRLVQVHDLRVFVAIKAVILAFFLSLTPHVKTWIYYPLITLMAYACTVNWLLAGT